MGFSCFSDNHVSHIPLFSNFVLEMLDSAVTNVKSYWAHIARDSFIGFGPTEVHAFVLLLPFPCLLFTRSFPSFAII